MTGYVLPAILNLVSRTSSIQDYAASWQMLPLSIPLLALLSSRIYTTVKPIKNTGTPDAADKPKDLDYLKIIYFFTFVISLRLHITTIFNVLTSETLTLRSAFFPSFISHIPPTVDTTLRDFYLVDFWIFALATYGWCVNAVWDIKRVGRTTISVGVAAVVLLSAVIMVGPGATIVGCWYWRELAMSKTSVTRKAA